MYSNNILNFQVSTIILNTGTKKVWKLIEVIETYIELLHPGFELGSLNLFHVTANITLLATLYKVAPVLNYAD